MKTYIVYCPNFPKFQPVRTETGDPVVLAQPFEGGKMGRLRNRIEANGTSTYHFSAGDEVLGIHDGPDPILVKYEHGCLVIQPAGEAPISVPATDLLVYKTKEGYLIPYTK